MKKRYGKKTKWIKTRYAKPYKRRLLMGRAMAVGLIASATSRLNAIRSLSSSDASKSEKAMAAMGCYIETADSVKSACSFFLKDSEKNLTKKTTQTIDKNN